MFAFIKNLFNFSKTDTNRVEKNQKVELESNDGHSRLPENVKIEDTSLNEICKTSENDENDELIISKTSGNDELSISNFFSNETASNSSKINGSFDSTLNSIYKRQRRSSKAAAIIMIKDIAEELSSRSYENNNAPAQNKLYKSIRLCKKCKTLKTFFGNVTKPQNCDKCNGQLLYLCLKCGEKLYGSYKGLNAHEKSCNDSSSSQKLVDTGNKTVLNQQQACYKKICNKKSMRYHVQTVHIEKQDSRSKNFEDVKDKVNSKEKVGKTNKEKVITDDKQIKTESLSRWMQRYCEKCEKTVKLQGALKRRPMMKCKTCNALLRYRCIKCHVKYISNGGINYHLRSKCLIPITFKCDMCSYQSQFKTNLRSHIESVHLQNKISCQKCSFETMYQSNLRRHERILHSSK